MGWRPNQRTSKKENVALIHARRHNYVARNLSILFSRSLTND